MRKVSPDMDAKMDAQVFHSISADVSFASNQFPKYKLGADNEILEETVEVSNGLSLMKVVEQESANLSEQYRRLSVRDLATKFDKNLVVAAKLTDEAKLKEPSSLEGHVLLKKLRDALESLRGRLAGRNKEDVESAISMVEALAVKLTQKEGELIQEKFEVKKLINFLKQASKDAKKLVNQEKSFACAEIESARAVVQRFGEALEEEESKSQTSNNQGLDDLLEEVQEGRRIKLLHQRSKMMEMELEILALKLQIREKSIFTVNLQKELAMSKRAEVNKSSLYSLHGSEALCSCLRLQPRTHNAPQLSECSIRWYRVSDDETQKELISGANKSIYAPEPFDVGRVLQAEIIYNGKKITVSTVGPIESGLENYVEKLLQKSNSDFHVVITQMNGQAHSSKSVHKFHVGKMRMKLSKGWITKARENYSTSMQLCAARSTVHAAGKSLFWQVRRGHSFQLTFDSERDRNAAIMLARRYALDCNINLAGPDDIVYK